MKEILLIVNFIIGNVIFDVIVITVNVIQILKSKKTSQKF